MGSQEKPSRSHFSHFYDNSSGLNGQGVGPLGDEGMRVSAGLVYRSPANGHASEVNGSFVSATLNGEEKPARVETTVVGPDRDHQDGRSTRGQAIGHVTLNGAQFEIPNCGHPTVQHNGSTPRFGHCSPNPCPKPDPCQKITIWINVQNQSKTKYNFEVDVTYTVERLKRLIYKEFQLPTDQQKLNFSGKRLEGSRTLGSYGIQEGSLIYVEGQLRGG